MRGWRWAAACAVAVGMTFAAVRGAAAESGASLDGVWVGYFGYNNGAEDVPFQAHFDGEGASISGTTVEPNTFGDRNRAFFLTATLTGSATAAGKVRIEKTYDGTGGQSHTVLYDGALDSAGRCIVGDWFLGGASGPFRMCSDARFLAAK